MTDSLKVAVMTAWEDLGLIENGVPVVETCYLADVYCEVRSERHPGRTTSLSLQDEWYRMGFDAAARWIKEEE